MFNCQIDNIFYDIETIFLNIKHVEYKDKKNKRK